MLDKRVAILLGTSERTTCKLSGVCYWGWGPLPSADRGSIRLKIDISHTLETPSYTAELQVHIGTNGEVRNFGSVSTARAVIAAALPHMYCCISMACACHRRSLYEMPVTTNDFFLCIPHL